MANKNAEPVWSVEEERRIEVLQYAINANSLGGLPACTETILEDAQSILDFIEE